MDYFTSNSKGVTVIPPMLLPLTDFFSFYFQPSLSAPDCVFACIYGIPESNLLIAFPAKESWLVGLYSKKPAPYTPWLHIFTRAGDQFLIASSLAVAVARRALILKLMFNQTSIQAIRSPLRGRICLEDSHCDGWTMKATTVKCNVFVEKLPLQDTYAKY